MTVAVPQGLFAKEDLQAMLTNRQFTTGKEYNTSLPKAVSQQEVCRGQVWAPLFSPCKVCSQDIFSLRSVTILKFKEYLRAREPKIVLAGF